MFQWYEKQWCEEVRLSYQPSNKKTSVMAARLRFGFGSLLGTVLVLESSGLMREPRDSRLNVTNDHSTVAHHTNRYTP